MKSTNLTPAKHLVSSLLLTLGLVVGAGATFTASAQAFGYTRCQSGGCDVYNGSRAQGPTTKYGHIGRLSSFTMICWRDMSVKTAGSVRWFFGSYVDTYSIAQGWVPANQVASQTNVGRC